MPNARASSPSRRIWTGSNPWGGSPKLLPRPRRQRANGHRRCAGSCIPDPARRSGRTALSSPLEPPDATSAAAGLEVATTAPCHPCPLLQHPTRQFACPDVGQDAPVASSQAGTGPGRGPSARRGYPEDAWTSFGGLTAVWPTLRCRDRFHPARPAGTAVGGRRLRCRLPVPGRPCSRFREIPCHRPGLAAITLADSSMRGPPEAPDQDLARPRGGQGSTHPAALSVSGAPVTSPSKVRAAAVRLRPGT